MSETLTLLDIDDVQFDMENPRIKMALEKYGARLDATKVHFALESAPAASPRASSYSSLRDSIRATNGITIPITVIRSGHGYKCIDGNTRLAIYREFRDEGEPGPWEKIPAVLRVDATEREIEQIRVSAHLVGAREWPAYEKARYLHYLRSKRFMSFAEMVELCGGNRPRIERDIQAYHDMNEFYRDVVDDSSFHIDRFSGFVELQKPRIKQSIFEAGLQLENFGEWIRDGKIYRLADVRQLPRVLADSEAKNVFLEGGVRAIEDAIRVLESRRSAEATGAGETTLAVASLQDLADALTGKIRSLPYEELRSMKLRESEDAESQVTALVDLSIRLGELLEDVGE